jgi:thiol:disulfide interchange protein/DsbC/DsbD-like thiol-disulfide interchange protein
MYMASLLKQHLFIALLSLVSLAVQAQSTASTEHVNARLIPEMMTTHPGSTLWLALELEHAEHWHTYWLNPGDAGQPTRIEWNLPEGVSAGEIVWPLPKRFELPGNIVDFGYEGTIALLIPLTIAEDYQAEVLQLSASVNWLECDDICIPGRVGLSLSIPVSSSNDEVLSGVEADLFAATRLEQADERIHLDATWYIEKSSPEDTLGELKILLQSSEHLFAGLETVAFLPIQHELVNYLDKPEFSVQEVSLMISQQLHEYALEDMPEQVQGLLLATDNDGKRSIYKINAAMASGFSLSDLNKIVEPAEKMSLFLVWLFALAGGIILNLMPCVFPVLSLKVLSLSTHADDSGQQRRHAMAYTLGVISSFLLLASVLLILQAGGAVIGWGFQLQQPWVVTLLTFLFFLIGLALTGFLEVGTSLMGLGGDLQERQGLQGSFFTGVLAVVVASPCTAPFMGAALGFAFTQSMPIALSVFLALGIGMALPFLLLSYLPALVRFLPRPGAWMLTFRQLLAYPMYLTAIWLLWVLGQQTGSDGMALVLAACLAIAMSAWLWSKQQNMKGWLKVVSVLLLISCFLFIGSVFTSPLLQPRIQISRSESQNFEPWSKERLTELRQRGQPVFVNMTASWCITCLVNERVALDTEGVREALVANNVTYLKGDWTNSDPAITAVLKEYNTSGVPLYLLFPSGFDEPAIVLPQILSESLVVDVLNSL